MVEGLHSGFYYVVRGRILRVFSGRILGEPLLTCSVCLSSDDYDLHTVAWCRIDLHHAELCKALANQDLVENPSPNEVRSAHFAMEGD